MGEFTFYLKQPPASELANGLAKIAKEVSPNSVVSHFSISTNSGDVDFLGPNPGNISVSQLMERPSFISGLEFLNARPFLDVIGGGINMNTDGYNISISQDKAFHFRLTTSGHRNQSSTIFPVVDAIHRHFNIQRKTEAFEALLPDSEKSTLKTAQNILLDFSSQAARLSQLSASNTERMNEIIIKKTEELDARYFQKNKELDDTYTNKSKELANREEAFRKERAGLDARENTVVRRDLLKQIEKILGDQKKIEITSATVKKRIPIHVICIAAMTLAICLVGAFGNKIYRDSIVDWHHIAPFSTGVLLFVSTAIFYIRWNDLWFKEHANAEFENRKFYVDTVRASWIAELLFEWKDKKEVPFPEQLITSYTTGLFQSSDIVKTAKHPFDDLKSLAGSVSEIKFTKKGGISFRKNKELEE